MIKMRNVTNYQNLNSGNKKKNVKLKKYRKSKQSQEYVWDVIELQRNKFLFRSGKKS